MSSEWNEAKERLEREAETRKAEIEREVEMKRAELKARRERDLVLSELVYFCGESACGRRYADWTGLVGEAATRIAQEQAQAEAQAKAKAKIEAKVKVDSKAKAQASHAQA